MLDFKTSGNNEVDTENHNYNTSVSSVSNASFQLSHW